MPSREPLYQLSPVSPSPAVHEFDLRLAVVGNENAMAVRAMLLAWLGDVGAPQPASPYRALPVGGEVPEDYVGAKMLEET